MKCQFCQKNEASIPIEDSETIKEVMVCPDCYNEIYWEMEAIIQELNAREIK